jgi:hypothetical protein
MRSKEQLRKNHKEWCSSATSYKEYCGYQDCVAKIRLGDQVKIFLVDNSFYSCDKTSSVSDWMEVIGKGENLILVGSKNRFGSLYSARDASMQPGITYVDNYQDYFCWYVTTYPNIEGRIADLRKAT